MDNQKVGCFLSGLRKEKGLTQGELATHFNVTHQSVSKWEKGDSLPDIQVLREIAKFYEITIEEILNGEKNEHVIKSRSSEMQSKLNMDIVYTVFLLGMFISFTFFYLHENVTQELNEFLGELNPFFGNGYYTLNFSGFNLIFNATGISIYTASMWIIFLSLITLLVVKSVNMYSIIKHHEVHSITDMKLGFNLSTMLEVLIFACYIAMAIAMLITANVVMGIGFFIGLLFIVLIYVQKRIKTK